MCISAAWEITAAPIPVCLCVSHTHGGVRTAAGEFCPNLLTIPPSLCVSAVSRRALIDCMCCDETRDLYKIGPSPPFAAQFQPGTQTVAVGDEEGYVTLVDTTLSCNNGSNATHYMCHNNAIFDLAWVPGHAQLLTASGDQTIRLSDVATQAEVRCFRGHRASVKAISTLDANTFASGGREGDICVWDDRLAEPRPSLVVSNAHEVAPPGGKRKRGTGVSAGVQSVSCVCFLDDAKLASAGASDGAIKIWDLRMLASGSSKAAGSSSGKSRVPAPIHVISPPVADRARPRGITALAVDPTGCRLLAMAAKSSVIYMYDTRFAAAASPAVGSSSGVSGSSECVAQFSAHCVDSFYVKAAFSPDGRHIVSGSSDAGVYVWETARPNAPPVVLWGHTTEVTTVAWCPSDFTTLVSASDDAEMRVWHVDRENGPASQRMAELRLTPTPAWAGVGAWAAHASVTSPASPGAPPETDDAPPPPLDASASASSPPRPPPPQPPTPPPAPPSASRDATLRGWLISRPAPEQGPSGSGPPPDS